MALIPENDVVGRRRAGIPGGRAHLNDAPSAGAAFDFRQTPPTSLWSNRWIGRCSPHGARAGR